MNLNPAALLKYALYRTGKIKDARLWKEVSILSPLEVEKMEDFLRKNFSLQTS